MPDSSSPKKDNASAPKPVQEQKSTRVQNSEAFPNAARGDGVRVQNSQGANRASIARPPDPKPPKK